MAMTKDMTKGTPYKLILAFAIPMVFGNIFQQFYNMVDTVIVGKFVGVNALAAVGSTGAINFLVIGFALGICSGFSIPIAQSFGAGDHKKLRQYLANAIYLSVVIAVILTVVTVLLTGPILRVTKTPDEIYDDAYRYISVIFGGISATIFYNMLSGVLRALGDSKTPLIFLGISSVINIVLDLTFIIVFDMGVVGASLATVIAQAVSAALCLIYIIRNYDILRFEKGEMKFSPEMSKQLLSVGLPMAFQFSITAIGSIILQSAVNSLGTAVVAATTAAQKIQLIAIGPLESMGITMATYCGQNQGAGEYERIKVGLKQSILISLIYSVAVCALVSFLGGAMTTLFVDKANTSAEIYSEIIKLSQYYLRITGIFYPLLGVLFILRNSLQGLGYSMLPMMAGVSELAARTLVVFSLVSTLGYTAACLASPVAWIFADVVLVITTFIKLRDLKKNMVLKTAYQS